MENTPSHICTEKAGVIIQQLTEEYLASQHTRPGTAVIRSRAFTLLREFLDSRGCERAADVTAADLEAWRSDLIQRKFAPASVEVFCRSVRQFFDWLERGQRLFINPAAGLVVSKAARAILPVLTQEQIQRFLSQPSPDTATGKRDRALLAVVYYTGLGLRELIALHHQDASRESLEIQGRKPRTVPLRGPVIEVLRRYLNEARPRLLCKKTEPALWLNRQGEALTQGAVQQAFSRHSKAAGLGYATAASVRRACAMHLWRAGMHPVDLQLLLGHASLRTLCQFLRVTAVELFKVHKELPHETNASA
jgi:integrase/recombinase XerD